MATRTTATERKPKTPAGPKNYVVLSKQSYGGGMYCDSLFATQDAAEAYIKKNSCGTGDEAEAYSIARITHRVTVKSVKTLETTEV